MSKGERDIIAAHITDASGGSGNVDTIINLILVALENEGIVAKA